MSLRAPRDSALGPVEFWAVYLRESAPPEAVESIEWMLLTTVAVHSFEQAVFALLHRQVVLLEVEVAFSSGRGARLSGSSSSGRARMRETSPAPYP